MHTDIDLRGEFPGARDQGTRPTCLAFAMSDAHMHAARHDQLFSPEYLHYFAAKQIGGRLNSGVTIAALRVALSSEGQPSEADCPYSDTRADDWSPATTIVPVWKRSSSVVTARPGRVVLESLRSTRPVVAVLRIGRSFYQPNPATHLVEEDGDFRPVLHAVLIVGVTGTNECMNFLARNSWGDKWGDAGHAWLPLAYVDSRASGLVAIGGEVDS